MMQMDCPNSKHVIKTSIEHLCDNLIRKILLGVPLKNAIQCKCINKTFNNLISDPLFASKHATHNTVLIHFQASLTPKFFYRLSLNPPYYNATDPCDTSITLSETVQVIGSSGGLLLLDVRRYRNYCVFNPVNRKYQLVPKSKSCVESIGIVLEQFTPPLQQYKLVALYKTNVPFPHHRGDMPHLHEDIVYGFEMFSLEENSWKCSNTTISCKQSNTYQYCQPIFANNAVHFLRERGDIVAFDMKKECARVVNVPHGLKIKYCKIWFGVSKGLITLVSSVSSEDLFFWEVHDYKKFEWKIGSRINLLPIIGPEISFRNSNNPILFDGERLVLQHYCSNQSTRKMYIYDLKLGEWVEIGKKANIKDNFQVYYSFLPSITEIRNVNSVINDITAPNLPFDLVRAMLEFVKLLST